MSQSQSPSAPRMTLAAKPSLCRVMSNTVAQATEQVNVLPLSGGSFSNSFYIEGKPKAPGETRIADYRAATPDISAR